MSLYMTDKVQRTKRRSALSAEAVFYTESTAEAICKYLKAVRPDAFLGNLIFYGQIGVWVF